jgi:hypothetical protein
MDGASNTGQNSGPEPNIIGYAHYSIREALFQIVKWSILFSMFTMLVHHCVQEGKYLEMVVMIMADLMAFLAVVDYTFSDRIIFYRDRVTKIWWGLGSKTIYYFDAKVSKNSKGLEWCQIREKGPNGKPFLFQIPIRYYPDLFHSQESEKILSILADLADVRTKFCANKSERQCVIIFALLFSIPIGAMLFIAWYRN